MDRRRGQLHIFGRIVTSCESSRTPICFNTTMARPVVQEVVFMGRVMEAAAPIQDFKAIKADIAIKGTRAIREVITIMGISSSSSRVIRAILSS